jgi:hypothetical protein
MKIKALCIISLAALLLLLTPPLRLAAQETASYTALHTLPARTESSSGKSHSRPRG